MEALGKDPIRRQEILLDKDYMEKKMLVIDEMYRYLYFDIGCWWRIWR